MRVSDRSAVQGVILMAAVVLGWGLHWWWYLP